VVGARSARDRREPLWRIGAPAFRRPGELRGIANQKGALGVEQRRLGHGEPQLVEATRRFEDFDVELRWPRAIPPCLHRPIDEKPLVAVDQGEGIQWMGRGHLRSIAATVCALGEDNTGHAPQGQQLWQASGNRALHRHRVVDRAGCPNRRPAVA